MTPPSPRAVAVVWKSTTPSAAREGVALEREVLMHDDGGLALVAVRRGNRPGDELVPFVASRAEWRAIVEAVAEARSAAARPGAYAAPGVDRVGRPRVAPDGGAVLHCLRCGFDVAPDPETGSTLAHERAVGPGTHPEVDSFVGRVGVPRAGKPA